ncbi:hypothetical protein DL771_001817 [Monosporascus sp. 5C6A]|nr:hypothetical protein DL771_001817 [Monosporascus sp. 5C6A]
MNRVRNLVVDIRYPVHMLDDIDLPRYPGFLHAPAWKWLVAGTTQFFPNVRDLRIETIGLDCRSRLHPGSGSGAPMPPPIPDNVSLYSAPEVWFFNALDGAAVEKCGAGSALPALRRFEIRKIEKQCMRLDATRCHLYTMTAFLKGKMRHVAITTSPREARGR